MPGSRTSGAHAVHRSRAARASTGRLLPALVAALCLAASGCGGGADDEPSAEPAPAPTERADAPSDAGPGEGIRPRSFEGPAEDFYVVPDGLPPGDPGDLIRYQLVEESGGSRTFRVMYRSNDASGADRAVTGLVTLPTAEPPPDGWPVVSYGHGTAGMAAPCAPSRDPRPAPTWGVEGIGAATDYVGLGPEGEIHPYLSRVSEGNSMIDIVTAAAQLPGAVASPRWVAVGHSQGGHAALAAHELAAARAPSLQLSATAALAPGVDTDTSYGVDDDLMTALTMMQLYGGAGEHEDIDPADYLTPAALGQAEVFSTGCVEAIIDAMGGVAAAEPFEVDPWSNEPARTMLESNRVGTERVEGVPVLLALGGADLTVVPQRVRVLFERLCGLGQSTRMVEVPAADHGAVIPGVFDELASFLRGALEDPGAVADDCPAP